MATKLPNDVTKLSADALAELLTQAQTEFDALLDLEDPSDADVTEAERLHPIVNTLQAETDRRVSAAADRSARMSALRTAPTDPGDGDGGDGDDNGGTGGNDPAHPEPAPQVNADASVEPVITIYAEDLLQSATESDTEFAKRQARYPHRDVAANAEVQQLQVVSATPDAPAAVVPVETVSTTAGGFVRQAAAKTQRPQRPGGNGAVVIRASADVPEIATGTVLDDMVATAKATLARMQGFPQWTPPNPSLLAAAQAGQNVEDLRHFGVATFRKPFPEELVVKPNLDAYETIMAASRETNLPGQSLTAAGGWCAPSEVLYDLCQDETTDGMLSIPEVQINRGGIKYTQGPDFSDIYNDTGFCQTEAEAISGKTKPCYVVPCPEFEEVRMDVCGVCIKVPILTQVGYPELVARVLSGSMIAHQHRMNAKVINAIATALGPAVDVPDINSSAQGAFNAVELIAEALRSKYRLGFNRAMEVVAPHWLLGAIRADLSFRQGVPLGAVSDAQINAEFAARGVAIQWVEDWQPLAVDGDGNAIGCPTGWPDTVELLVYPSGTFIKGVSDVIRLNAVYDAASLAVNLYTGLFFEEGVLVARTCYSGCAVTVNLCQAGITGSANNTECFAAAAVTP